LESELFGHEKGAFTGAAQQRVGRFEQASGGTLFLDEIGDMPPEIQTRLLRVLADGEFYRVGGHTPVKVDVRVIAATHQDLEELVKKNLFREDLFHRLNVIRLQLPSLADRSEDIPQLALHFLQHCGEELGVETKILSPEVVEYFSRLPWPGNVRQLENVCRWLTVMAAGTEIQMDALPPQLREEGDKAKSLSQGNWNEMLQDWAKRELQGGEKRILDMALPMFEKTMINAALQQTGGRKRDASLLLGWGRNTLTRKMKELGMQASEKNDLH
ncbi:MAG: sigma 54-interacting transcriptional regulator, partial [Pseudomonadales bacterium]|nr:sigma 54-interacting transcriptional regulator [Pseudomonadales bacterium]